MLIAGVVLHLLGWAIALTEIGGARVSTVAFGAAGLALVECVRSEAAAWRRPLTLGHQLAMWWFWPLAVPGFLIVTRARRSAVLTLAVVVPVLGFLLAVIAWFVIDLLHLLG
jgi:hypothetical protein